MTTHTFLNTLKRLSVDKQISFAFGALCLVIVLIGAVFFLSLRTIEHQRQTHQARAHQKWEIADELPRNAGARQAEVAHQLLETDAGEMARDEEIIRSLDRASGRILGDFKALLDDETERQLFARLVQARKTYLERTEDLLALSRTTPDAEATREALTRQSPAFFEYHGVLGELIEAAGEKARLSRADTSRVIWQLARNGGLLVGLAMLITAGTGLTVVSVTRRLRADNATLQNEITGRKRTEVSLRDCTEELATANAALQTGNVNRERTTIVLRESEEKFRQMAENITDAFWIRSADFQEVQYLSPGFERIWGRPRESLYANPLQWTEFILPEDRERVREAFATLLGVAANIDVEYRIVRPDGEQRWIRARGFQVRDAAGQLIRHTGIVGDITERKRAEEALRESEERFSGAFEHAPIGVALVSPDGCRWLKANRALCELLGYSEAELLIRTVQELTHPEDLAISRENVQRAVAGEVRSAQREKRYVHRDGHHITALLSISLVRDGQGEPRYFIAQLQDISARRRAEEELRSKTAFLEAQLDSSLDGILVVAADGRKVLQNRRTELFKIPAAIAEGDEDDAQIKWVADVVKNPEQFVERIAWLYSHPHEISRDETELKDGTISDRYSAPVIGANGTHYGRIWTFRDITERKRAEYELEQSRKALEQLNAGLEQRVKWRTEALLAATAEAERANRAKSEFLSRMSHELRTPMNAILGFAQVVETEDGLAADQHESVDQILKGGNHLLELINEVLDITSIESGRLTLSSEPIALAGLLTETISLLRPLSAELDIEIDVLTSESAGDYVQADRQRLKQVLLNLLGNALKYGRSGGSVTVRYGTADGSPAMTRLSVTDTGEGLSAAKLARLFNPFDRLGAEQTRVEGTGLGLALAKSMVEHMGGTLGVESVVGEGSTFWIELPTAEAPLDPEETVADLIPDSDPEVSADARVILYIEDNPSNVRLVTRILARRPAIRLLCAETGALGLKMAREHRPDLILLDLHLPDCHGDHVLTSLAEDPRTGAIPVVMVTADAVAGNRDAMLASGARGFITKPLDVRNFLGVVDRFLAVEPASLG